MRGAALGARVPDMPTWERSMLLSSRTPSATKLPAIHQLKRRNGCCLVSQLVLCVFR
jgi:hypothetical protein